LKERVCVCCGWKNANKDVGIVVDSGGDDDDDDDEEEDKEEGSLMV
jgi:hypothetical protein